MNQKRLFFGQPSLFTYVIMLLTHVTPTQLFDAPNTYSMAWQKKCTDSYYQYIGGRKWVEENREEKKFFTNCIH